MKKSALVMILMALLLAVTFIGVPYVRAALPAQDATGNLNHPAEQTPEEVAAFWSQERMDLAQPVPDSLFMTAPQEQATSREFLAQADGLPMFVAGNPPGAAANTPVQQILPGSAPDVTSLSFPYPFAYDRTSVPWTSLYTAFPFMTNGKLYFTNVDYGGARVCSATAVTSGPGGNENVVLTAAHCLKNGTGAWSENLYFLPGRRDGANLNGYWAAHDIWVRTSWSSIANIREDFGFMVTAPGAFGNLSDVVGAQGLAWNQSAQQQFWAFGYAAAPPFAGETMYVCTSASSALDTTSPGLGPYPVGIGCDLSQGTDGGGWLAWNNFLNAGYANSVFSYIKIGQQYAWYGPYFASSLKSLWDSARLEAVP